MQVEGPHTTDHGLEAVFGVGAAVAEGLGAVEHGQRGGFAAEAPVPRHRRRRYLSAFRPIIGELSVQKFDLIIRIVVHVSKCFLCRFF